MKIRISPFFVLYLCFFAFTGKISEGVAYLVTLILHEGAHSAQAKKCGYGIGSMKLSVFGASLSGNYEGMRAQDELSIAIAGPLLNAVLSVAFGALWWFFPSTYFLTYDLAIANFSMFLFNLLPVYPLDGGRVAIALMSKRMDRKKAFSFLRIFALVVILVFSIFCVFARNPSTAFSSLFMLVSTLFPDKTCKYHSLYRLAYRSEKLKRGLEVRYIAVFEDTEVAKAERMLNSRYYTCFLLLDESLSPSSFLPETAFETCDREECASVGQLREKYAKEEKKRTSSRF